MGISWLDVQLGVRMLIRYKGLTLAGGLALAEDLMVSAREWYDVVRDQLHPTLPLPGRRPPGRGRGGQRRVERWPSSECFTTSSTGAKRSAQSRMWGTYRTARAQSDSWSRTSGAL